MDHACPKCQSAMAKGRPNVPFQNEGKLTAFKEPVKAWGTNVSSTLSVYICSTCGFAEWYADHPERFAPDQ